jgi:hypothetical protein
MRANGISVDRRAEKKAKLFFLDSFGEPISVTCMDSVKCPFSYIKKKWMS